MELFTALNMPGAKPPVEDFPWLWLVGKLIILQYSDALVSIRYLPDSIMMNWKARTKKIGELMDRVYGGERFVLFQVIKVD
jgi:hypothetical protein